MTGSGHVFVVRGRLENLDHDAVVLPTDQHFSVGRRWHGVLGAEERLNAPGAWSSALRELRPHDWADRRWGRARRAPGFVPSSPTWFVDSANEHADPAGTYASIDALMQRLTTALADIDAANVPTGSGRPRPLIALPTLGVGRGGFGSVRGRVIDRLLETCQTAVERSGIDVVIVAADSADHAAFQARRRLRGGRHAERLTPELLQDAETLAQRAREGSLAVFLGAGVSMSVGLPSWGELVKTLSRRAGVDLGSLTSPLDQSELLRRVLGQRLGEMVAALTTASSRYGINHALLAALDCTEAVTTNYDDLYERAVGDVGHDVMPVLPFNPTIPKAPWLLKMHGDARHPETIVLSRSDFVGYDARSRPMGAIVQSLLMTKHLLVVGASMTDDNFLRLAHEVLLFKKGSTPHQADRRRPSVALGTVVALEADDAVRELWRGRFEYVAVARGGERDGVLARRLAIFLDAVAMLATEPSYIGDERYAALLDTEHTAVAAAARDLHRRILRLPDHSAWDRLSEALRDLGASSES